MSAKGVLLLTASTELAERVCELLAVEGLTQVEVRDPTDLSQPGDLNEPELVLQEVPAVGGDALAVLRNLRSRFEPGVVPVVALVTDSTVSHVGDVLVAGFDEAVIMPANVAELGVRVRGVLRLKRRCDELAQANRGLMELSSRDELTGLYSRRYFFECLALEFERGTRYQQPLSCIMIDLDEFKPVNDNFGHLVGDALFKKVAALFKSVPRKIDVVARYGGDEVVILLPATKPSPALTVAQRICETLAATTLRISGQDFVMTVSVGVATMDPENPISADELLRRVDVALYAAKRGGKNRVEVWSEQLGTEDHRPAAQRDIEKRMREETS